MAWTEIMDNATGDPSVWQLPSMGKALTGTYVLHGRSCFGCFSCVLMIRPISRIHLPEALDHPLMPISFSCEMYNLMLAY